MCCSVTTSTSYPHILRIACAFHVCRLLWLLILFLLWLGTIPAQAQQVQTITFNEAVQIALEQNVTLRRARNSVEMQAVNLKSEQADFLPNLNLSSNTTRNFGLSFDQTTGETFSTTTDRFSLNANSSINLFNGFADIASLKQAQWNLEANEHTYDRTRQDVVFNVISNFLQVILNDEQTQIREEDVTAQQQQLARIEEFTRVGLRPISDLYQQQAALANSELQLLETQRLAQLSKTRLVQVLQLDPLGQYTFVAPNAEAFILPSQQYQPEALVQSAFEQRADLRAQEANIEAASQNIRVARSGHLPTISLSGGIGTSFSDQLQRASGFETITDPTTGESITMPIAFELVPFGDQLSDNRFEFISLNVAIPIFNRWSTKTNVERARVQYENTRLDLENLQQSVAVEVRQAYLDYQTAVKRLDVTEKQLRAAEQALQVEQERYEVGASTLVELTQTRSNYVQASSNRAQAIFQFQFQHTLIEYYQGTLDPSQPLFR